MPQLRYKKKTILLFDSDVELAENIKLYLEDIYVVKLVNQSEEIISELRKNSYDFLISDLNSLNMQFGNIFNEIHIISPSTKIILMCTFFDAEINNERFILSKVDDYIFKPFNVNLLKYKLARLKAFQYEAKIA
jgi:response regulator RpfG family c-di-GMP phosphodiesterase